MSLGHEDGPGITERFGVGVLRGMARLAEEDARVSEALARQCGLDRSPEERREAREQQRAITAKANEARRRRNHAKAYACTPFWPPWATPLTREPEEWRCAACTRELNRHNTRGLCGGCQQRLGREAPRAALALRLYREGTP